MACLLSLHHTRPVTCPCRSPGRRRSLSHSRQTKRHLCRPKYSRVTCSPSRPHPPVRPAVKLTAPGKNSGYYPAAACGKPKPRRSAAVLAAGTHHHAEDGSIISAASRRTADDSCSPSLLLHHRGQGQGEGAAHCGGGTLPGVARADTGGDTHRTSVSHHRHDAAGGGAVCVGRVYIARPVCNLPGRCLRVFRLSPPTSL